MNKSYSYYEHRNFELPAGILAALDTRDMPTTFPLALWNERAEVNAERWKWFRGDFLLEKTDRRTPAGNTIPKYPLGINPVRNFSRKHAAILLGEGPDTSDPMVRTTAKPRFPMDDGESSEEDRKLARKFRSLINIIWEQSGGRGLQQEAAILSQFLGGTVFGLQYVPWRDDLLIPLTIRHISADYFMPVWEPGNYWRLLEAWVVYVIPAYVAQAQYGYDNTSLSPDSLVTYTEYWKPKTYSVLINGTPLKSSYSGTSITYHNVPNPFGEVPFMYIPAIREGSFWGSSIVDDIYGLVREFNARMTDLGDTVHLAVRRKRWGANIPGKIELRRMGDGTELFDLGMKGPMGGGDPNVEVEDSPVVPESVADFPDKVWNQLMRESSLSSVAFGHLDGTQRSGESLNTAMWPSIARGRLTRSFWSEGLNALAQMMGRATINISAIRKAARAIDAGIDLEGLKRLSISQDFYPFLPRDRAQLLNEVVLRKQTNTIDTFGALEEFGDQNPQDTLKRIREDMEFTAKLAMAGQQQPGQDNQGPKMDVNTPEASDGTKEAE